MRRAARKDENHNPLEKVLRDLLGDHVTDSSTWGNGAGDLFVSCGGESGHAFCCFVEIKRDSKAEYTPAQNAFRRRHPGCVFRVETVDDAINVATFLRTQVRRLAG